MAELAAEILTALEGVTDPEIGIDLADLGLIYRAVHENGAVEVDVTLTTRACPLGEMIVGDIRSRLDARFPDASRIDVNLVWEPQWHPDLITDRGRAQLGRPARSLP